MITHSPAIRSMVAYDLRNKATQHDGDIKAALLTGAAMVEAGKLIPADIFSLIEEAHAFTQNQYGK